MLRVLAVERNAETVRPGEQDGSKTSHCLLIVEGGYLKVLADSQVSKP